MKNYASALREAGMSLAAAKDKGRAFEQLQRAAKQLAFREPLHAFYVPGRIEVLGKHTDYAGGQSLVCCVERGFCVIASRREDRVVRFVDLFTSSTVQWEFATTPPTAPVPWAIYPATVTQRVARNFPSARNGVDVVFASDLPPAAGMSSSSALIVASFFAIAAANGLQDTEEFRQNLLALEDRATYLACVENGSSFRALSGEAGVGTLGGSEDHTAILCSEVGIISQYSFCPLRFERSIQLPDELTFVIAASGVASEKAGKVRDQYNQLAYATNSILETWNRTTGRCDVSLGAAVRSSPVARDQICKALCVSPSSSVPPGLLQNRFQQFVIESEVIVPEAADALARQDWDALGEVVDLSHSNAERLLANQVPETSFLARSARELGAIAASAFGAGFGGSVWSLVPKAESQEFAVRWASSYRERFPQHTSATFFVTAAGSGARSL